MAIAKEGPRNYEVDEEIDLGSVSIAIGVSFEGWDKIDEYVEW